MNIFDLVITLLKMIDIFITKNSIINLVVAKQMMLGKQPHLMFCRDILRPLSHPNGLSKRAHGRILRKSATPAEDGIASLVLFMQFMHNTMLAL